MSNATANTHIHTPYSFSGFDSIRHAIELASAQKLAVLGISDFNTTDGYAEFDRECRAARIFPLFNIEFIALLPEDREAGRRWNDPANPGVMYFCGKALDHPAAFSADSRNRLLALWKGTQDQIQEVIARLNGVLSGVDAGFSLDYTAIRSAYAKKTVRERHVARALADALRQKNPGDEKCLAAVRRVCGDAAMAVDVNDGPQLQNELRNRLLKAGKPAFIEEKPSAFLSLETVMTIILDGGGIPCYPVLVDDSRPLNEYEADTVRLAHILIEKNIFAVEFIPARNSFDHLKRCVKTFHDRGFCVTFGTEHNTPDTPSLVPSARKSVPFDDELNAIGYEGACILAAHQEMRKQGKSGYVDGRGKRLVHPDSFRHFAAIGETAIQGLAAG